MSWKPCFLGSISKNLGWNHAQILTGCSIALKRTTLKNPSMRQHAFHSSHLRQEFWLFEPTVLRTPTTQKTHLKPKQAGSRASWINMSCHEGFGMSRLFAICKKYCNMLPAQLQTKQLHCAHPQRIQAIVLLAGNDTACWELGAPASHVSKVSSLDSSKNSQNMNLHKDPRGPPYFTVKSWCIPLSRSFCRKKGCNLWNLSSLGISFGNPDVF